MVFHISTRCGMHFNLHAASVRPRALARTAGHSHLADRLKTISARNENRPLWCMKAVFWLVPLLGLLTQCGGRGGTVGSLGHGRMTQVVNVSAYDPKERQRDGRGYHEHDVSALRANGAAGLIARCGKGGVLDPKCANFLAAADREGMQIGAYYRLQNHVDAVAQADQFVSRMQAIAASRSWKSGSLLLCGDFDAKSRLSDITRFIDRVHSRTGRYPVIYLENSEHLKLLLSRADEGAKAKLRRCPYWVALYSPTSGAGRYFPAAGSPDGLVDHYNVWKDWSLWQYGGVDWESGRSRPKVYSSEQFRAAPYLGDLDRPVERNVFKGDPGELAAFWSRHGIPTR
jgi:GH25 family lysozyme M1 (1,4-beta-N-acetylmuramidase)